MRWCGAVVLTLLLVLSSAGAWADAPPPDEVKLGEFIPATPPQPAPAIAFADFAGKDHHLGEFAGHLVLVNLWATWCGPCLREMPSLERLKASLGDRITILAISEDRGGAKVVEPFVAKLGLAELKFYLDPMSKIGFAFGVEGLPTSVLIDGNGQVLGKVEGAASWDSPRMLDILRRFVPREAPAVIKSSFVAPLSPARR